MLLATMAFGFIYNFLNTCSAFWVNNFWGVCSDKLWLPLHISGLRVLKSYCMYKFSVNNSRHWESERNKILFLIVSLVWWFLQSQNLPPFINCLLSLQTEKSIRVCRKIKFLALAEVRPNLTSYLVEIYKDFQNV